MMRYIILLILLISSACFPRELPEYPATTVPVDVLPGEPGSKEWCLSLDYPNNYCMNLGWVPE